MFRAQGIISLHTLLLSYKIILQLRAYKFSFEKSFWFARAFWQPYSKFQTTIDFTRQLNANPQGALRYLRLFEEN